MNNKRDPIQFALAYQLQATSSHYLMLSDLSPGDKLSLKGKIFELQKKLQIIDIRNRQKEEFSYKPTLYNYDLPNRDNNVLDSINKAEIIRKV